MAKAGDLERGHVRARLIRDLATGDHSQVELARRYGVKQPSVSAFAARHAERIADVAEKLDNEFAALWAADKFNRCAEYQQDAEDVARMLADPELAAKAGVQYAEMVRVRQTALRAIADELGQIPARLQVQHSGSLSVEVNGVDLAALR